MVCLWFLYDLFKAHLWYINGWAKVFSGRWAVRESFPERQNRIWMGGFVDYWRWRAVIVRGFIIKSGEAALV